MGIFISAGVLILYWIIGKFEMYSTKKALDKNQQELKKKGFRYYE